MFLKETHDDDGRPDFRPAVHDSDAFAVWNAQGERVWRPLINPRQMQHTVFLEDELRGFELTHRERTFAAYEDLEANYHTRPSAWVEPRGPWGTGAARLFELPTEDEYFDNIVAFWRPQGGLRAGMLYAYTYRLTWCNDTPAAGGYRVSKTRLGQRKHSIRFVVDFVQERRRRPQTIGAAQLDLPSPIVRASHGVCGAPHVQRNRYTGGLRVSFEFDPGSSHRSDLRLDLPFANPASECWRYRWLRE